MRIAIVSDIHANLEAFRACLEDAQSWGVERYVLLGDIIGYGPDPVAVTELAMRMADEGAVCVLGNHDAALGKPNNGMNGLADAAIRWTNRQLNDRQRTFLVNLPMTYRDHDRLFVHANAAAPGTWWYIDGPQAAAESLRCAGEAMVFCGHIHVPALYGQASPRRIDQFAPVADAAVHLSDRWRWLVVAGSCGQPRDGNPAACYLRFDTASRDITFRRLSYDIGRVVEKIRTAGLPEALADRLMIGR